MKIQRVGFNLLLWVVILALGWGCKTTKDKNRVLLQCHVEVNPDGSDRSGPVMIGRERAFSLNVERQAFLTEQHVARASVADALGGYQLLVQFDRHGTWVLEQYSVANKGQRVAILASVGTNSARWVAAPMLTQRISDGLLAFTPDATREESQRFVDRLNKLAKTTQKNNP